MKKKVAIITSIKVASRVPTRPWSTLANLLRNGSWRARLNRIRRGRRLKASRVTARALNKKPKIRRCERKEKEKIRRSRLSAMKSKSRRTNARRGSSRSSRAWAAPLKKLHRSPALSSKLP